MPKKKHFKCLNFGDRMLKLAFNFYEMDPRSTIWIMNYGPFNDWTHYYHLNTGLVHSLSPHCILNKKDPNKIIFTIFGNFKILCLSVSPYSCLYVTILPFNPLFFLSLSFFYPSLDVFFAAWICFKIVRLPWASPLLNLVTMLTSQLSTIFKYSKQKLKSGII